MNAALLARVSLEKQADADRHSLPKQLADMRAYAAAQGWPVVREYIAPGERAYTHDLAARPVMRDMLAGAVAGEFDVVLIHESSRLSRNVELAHSVLRQLREAGVALIDVTSPLDYESAEGRVMFGISSVFNEFYSRQLSRHIRKGKDQQFAEGLPVGSLPFGYERGADRVPVQVAAEADALRTAYEMRRRGSGYIEITDMLNERGMHPRSRVGRATFTVSAVQSLMENPFYCGDVFHKGQIRHGAHQPIVDRETWTTAQLVVVHHQRSTVKLQLCTGTVVCQDCGRRLHQSTTGPAGYRTPYYRHPPKPEGEACVAAGKMWSARAVDSHVATVLAAMLSDRAWLAKAAKDAARPARRGAGRRAALKAQRERAGDAYIRGVLTLDQVRAALDRIDSELAALGPETEEAKSAARTFESFADVWALALPEERREPIQIIFKAIHVDLGRRLVVFEPRPHFARLFQHRGASLCGIAPDRNRGEWAHKTRFALTELVAA